MAGCCDLNPKTMEMPLVTTGERFYYRSYGLTVASQIRLPELVEVEPTGEPDVLIEVEVEPTEEPPEYDSLGFDVFARDHAIFRFRDVGELSTREGRLMHVRTFAGADQKLLRGLITGQLFSSLLYQRDIVVIHASVVRMAEKTVGFVGLSGAGKSTMAVACCRNGHGLLTDDTAALERTPEGYIVHAGFPHVKLSPEASERLGLEDERFYTLNRYEAKKRGVRLDEHFVADGQKIDTLYLLDEDADCRIERTTAKDALVGLLPHVYPTRLLLLYPRDRIRDGQRHQLTMLAPLVATVPVFRLYRPRDLERLPDVVALVEQHARSCDQ